MDQSNSDNLVVIGQVERIDLPKLGVSGVPAKIDTGADSSSVWASDISESDAGLSFCLFGQGSEFFSGQRVTIGPGEYQSIRVANSFGHRQQRYKVKLTIRVQSRLVNGSFTLADRSTKMYPMLLGRSLLRGRFTVDVKAGQPFTKEQREVRQQEIEALRQQRGMA